MSLARTAGFAQRFPIRPRTRRVCVPTRGWNEGTDLARTILSGSLSSRVFLGYSPRAGGGLCPAGSSPPRCGHRAPGGSGGPRPDSYLLTAAEEVLRPPIPAEAAVASPEVGDQAQVGHPPGLHPEALLLGASFCQGRGLHSDSPLQLPRCPTCLRTGSAWTGEAEVLQTLKQIRGERDRCPERAIRLPAWSPAISPSARTLSPSWGLWATWKRGHTPRPRHPFITVTTSGHCEGPEKELHLHPCPSAYVQ